MQGICGFARQGLCGQIGQAEFTILQGDAPVFDLFSALNFICEKVKVMPGFSYFSFLCSTFCGTSAHLNAS
jgi:hypothetical protein